MSFSRLPLELLQSIAAHVETVDMMSFVCTCKRFKTCGGSLWQWHVRQRYDEHGYLRKTVEDNLDEVNRPLVARLSRQNDLWDLLRWYGQSIVGDIPFVISRKQMLDKIQRENLASEIVELGEYAHLPFRNDNGEIMQKNGRYVTPTYSFYLIVFEPFDGLWLRYTSTGWTHNVFDVDDVDHPTRTFVAEIPSNVKEWFYGTWKVGIVARIDMERIRANVARCEARLSCPP